jgi:hypothetical protein
VIIRYYRELQSNRVSILHGDSTHNLQNSIEDCIAFMYIISSTNATGFSDAIVSLQSQWIRGLHFPFSEIAPKNRIIRLLLKISVTICKRKLYMNPIIIIYAYFVCECILYSVYDTGLLLTTKCTMLGHCGMRKCNLLGYWWHHSICYTGLFTTLRVVITVSPYNVFWPSDVLSRSGPWISSVLNAGSWLTDWLLVTDLTIRCY